MNKVYPIRVAETAREREAIYRLRYRVMVEEQLRTSEDVDHEKRWVRSPVDDLPNTFHMYLGTPDRVVCACRMQWWRPGEVPAAQHAEWSMERIPELDALGTAVLSKLVADPDCRGNLGVFWLTQISIREVARRIHAGSKGERRGSVMFANSAPGLVPVWQMVGMSAYGGRLQDELMGLAVPLVITTASRPERRAPLPVHLGYLPRWDDADWMKWAPLDPHAFDRAFSRDTGVISDARAIEEQVTSFVERDGDSVLHRLPPRVLRSLSKKAVLLRVDPGRCVLTQGCLDQELYIPLTGSYRVVRDGVKIGEIGAGDLFGEVAYFSKQGRRFASVVAETDSVLLVVRRGLFKQIAKDSPRDALLLTSEMSRSMADRLAGSSFAPHLDDAVVSSDRTCWRCWSSPSLVHRSSTPGTNHSTGSPTRPRSRPTRSAC